MKVAARKARVQRTLERKRIGREAGRATL